MSSIIAGVVRHFLTAAGGALVTSGYLSGDEANAAVGAVATLVGLVWSIYTKRSKG